eukprot:2955795-Rhodomonas_salina.1
MSVFFHALHPVDRVVALDELAFRAYRTLAPMCDGGRGTCPQLLMNSNKASKKTWLAQLTHAEYPLGSYAISRNAMGGLGVSMCETIPAIPSSKTLARHLRAEIKGNLDVQSLQWLVPKQFRDKAWVVAAGGFVMRHVQSTLLPSTMSIACKAAYMESDIDLFLVGEWTEAACNEMLTRLIRRKLVDVLRPQPDMCSSSLSSPFVLTNQALTIYLPMGRNGRLDLTIQQH